MSKQYVRRDIIALLGGVGTFVLAGCLGENGTVEGEPSAAEEPTATPEATPEQTPAAEVSEESGTDVDTNANVVLWGQAHGTAGKTGFTTETGPETGTIQWTRKLDGGVETSPVVLGNLLFVASRKTLFALAVEDGTKHWSQPFEAQLRYTPACTEDTVFVASDQLYALSPEDGESRWSSAVGGGPATDLTVHDGVVYFGAADSMVYGLRVTDGKQVARSALFSFGGVQTPAADDMYLYVTAKKGVVALNERGSQVWKHVTSAAVESAPMVDGDTVYAGAVDGTVFGLDRKTGAERWSVPLNGSVLTPPTISDGGLFVVAGTTLYKLEPGTGRIEWEQKIADTTLTAMAHTPSGLYVGSLGHRILALAPENGALRWSAKTQSPVGVAPSVAGNHLYVGSSDGTVYALE